MKIIYSRILILGFMFLFAVFSFRIQVRAGYGDVHILGDNVVDSNGTIWVITTSNSQTVRKAYTSAGAFLSYGFNNWGNIFQASSADLSLPDGGFVPPRDGKIICSDRGSDKGTCYLITGAQKAGFTSESVFKGLGYNFGRATFGDVSWMASTSLIDSFNQYHKPGTLTNDYGTIYLVTESGLLGIASMQILNGWGYSLDDVVSANNFDRSLPKNSLAMPVRLPGQLSPIVSTPFNTPPIGEPCKVYTYQDRYYYGLGKHCLDKTSIKGIYFVAKNQISGIKTYWKDSMLDIFSQIKVFYENQFDHKVQITIDTPLIVYGDKNIEEYNQYTIEQEIRQKVQIDSTNSFVSLMFYPVQGENEKRVQGDVFGGGGEVGNSSSAMNGWFWLDPLHLGTVTSKVGTDYSGYLGSAHEFGHSLGIPHPWQEEVNIDSVSRVPKNTTYGNEESGSIMSYGGQKGPLIPQSFIRDTIKEKMIVK